LKILHGKGNGTLKNLVKQVATDYKDFDQIWHPDPDQGGDGISFVKFK
jgi:DNA-nicking Smr family endonuclease